MAVAPVTSRPAVASGAAAFWHRVRRSFWTARLVKAVLTIYIVITITFFLVHLLPGSPIEVYIQNLIATYGVPYDQARAQASALYDVDLSQPVGLQYLQYLGHLLHGDMGTSITAQGTPVSTIIRQYLPWTLFSVGLGLLLSFAVGVLLGLLMAYRRESVLDHVLSTVASVLSSVPNYFIGLMIMLIFGVRLGWFDVAAMRGSYSADVHPGFTLHFLVDIIYHAELPILTYFITTVGTWMLLMKSNTLSALEEDYVTVAKARGLRERRIMTAYVGRNAVLPVFTQFAITLGFVVGGSVLIESVFSYQGIGYILYTSINTRDYPVMQGVFLVITMAVVGANLLADFLYSKLDPRIGSRSESQ
jgi:peptide/nickel transport system permease protein